MNVFIFLLLFASAKFKEAWGAMSKHILICGQHELPCCHLLLLVKVFHFVRYTKEGVFHVDRMPDNKAASEKHVSEHVQTSYHSTLKIYMLPVLFEEP